MGGAHGVVEFSSQPGLRIAGLQPDWGAGRGLAGRRPTLGVTSPK